MPPQAAARRESTRPFDAATEPPADRDGPRSVPVRRRENTAPFGTVRAAATSDIREIAPRSSYRPSAPSMPPKARMPLSALAKKTPAAAPARSADESGTRPIQRRSAPPLPRPDPTPVVSKMPPPPPMPRQARASMPPVLTALETVELPLEEIDYDEAYKVDLASIGIRRSIVPPALAGVARDVRASLAPPGRAEAKRELVRMKRSILLGTALLLYRIANMIEARA